MSGMAAWFGPFHDGSPTVLRLGSDSGYDNAQPIPLSGVQGILTGVVA